MSKDLLFELGCEELPSASVWPLAVALANNLTASLAKAGLAHNKVLRFASPRRLSVLIESVQTDQPSQKIVRRGPPYSILDGNSEPPPALIGFARSCGVELSELTKLTTDKGEWWAYEAEKPGVSTSKLLPQMIKDAVANLPIAKPMRWGNGDAEFARPVHWAVLLFGNEVVHSEVLGVCTGNKSIGHRFHHPETLEITSPTLYESLLKDAYVIADFHLRRQMIIQQVQDLAQQRGFHAEMPEALVDEVTSIVEWPQALLADFAPEFLNVPAQALIAAMQSHQKCFALRDSKGNLAPHFITVANIASINPQQVIQGNEKVMRARLSDAAFFYNQDKKRPLSELRSSTANVVCQAQLGSLQDKALRVHHLMGELVTPLDLNADQALRAAELSKCDLMTGMVGEFPELQGLMGYYYALHDGEAQEVATALNEQYMPRFAADELPQTPLGQALSLADRLDTLVGTFAIGAKPTSVKDPFKLRRHALAVVRLLVAMPASLQLSTLIECTWHAYKGTLGADSKEKLVELQLFILERLQSYYQGQGISTEVIRAVRMRQDDWLFDIDMRIKALMDFITLPEAISLSAACKRVSNILQQAGIKEHENAVEQALLVEEAEKKLYEQIQTMEHQVSSLYASKEYGQILNQLARLRAPVDEFFDKVLVMAEDSNIKANRLRLLARLNRMLQGVADISLLQLSS